jgi:hypothetical protein
VDMQQTATTVQRQRHFREVNRRERRTVVGVFASLPATSRPMFSCAS